MTGSSVTRCVGAAQIYADAARLGLDGIVSKQ
jgi:hypothetical protein